MHWILIILLCLLTNCSDRHLSKQEEFRKWVQTDNKIRILSTTGMIHDIVKQIGAEHVMGLTLIQGDLDPHSYQLVKGDDEKLSFAHLIFYSGIGLEHGPSLHHYLSGNPKAISLGDYLAHQDPASIVYVNGQKDPHIWMDVSLWAKTIPLIVEKLSQYDPLHAQEFQTNGANLAEEMAAAHDLIRSILHQAPPEKRFMVTSHDAFNYFARAYLSDGNEIATGEWQKRFVAPEGLAPESQLSTMDIKFIIDHMSHYNLVYLFPESNISRDSIKKIVQAGREKGLNLQLACCPLYVDAMGSPGSEGDTYLKMMLYNANMIARYMKE